MKTILTLSVFFPGLALLQMQRGMPIPERELPEAPSDLIQEATVLHPYAEAAYTVKYINTSKKKRILRKCFCKCKHGDIYFEFISGPAS